MIMLEKIRPLDCVMYSDKESAVKLANMLKVRWAANEKSSPYLVRVEELLNNSGYKVYLYFKKAMDLYQYRQAVIDQRGGAPAVFDLRNAVPFAPQAHSGKSS